MKKLLTIKTGWFSTTTIDLEHYDSIHEHYGSCDYFCIPVAYQCKTTGQIVKGTVSGYELYGKRYGELK